MDEDKLEATNRLLHDLERKLSLVSSSLNNTAYSHGSVVHNSSHSGLARSSIQLSVLSYIKNHSSDFDTDQVYTDCHQRYTTTFNREYVPENVDSVAQANPISSFSTDLPATSLHVTLQITSLPATSLPATSLQVTSLPAVSLPATSLPISVLANRSLPGTSTPTLSNPALIQDISPVGPIKEEHDINDQFLLAHDEDYYDKFDPIYDFDSSFSDNSDSETNDDDFLIPPLPPRLPPKQMDPDKLYGLYDFLGPDPLHCTLWRDEPVVLLNDLDNYWWLVRKLTKVEREAGRNLSLCSSEIYSEEDDGKIGFVPAECLETHFERLARLNCFKNEELEKSSKDTLPLFDEGNNSTSSALTVEDSHLAENVDSSINEKQKSSRLLSVRRTGSILKGSSPYKKTNKLVTFENLDHLDFDDDNDADDSDSVDFTDHYYAFEHVAYGSPTFEADGHSEVLSDVYPAGIPLNVTKSTRGKKPQLFEELLLQPKSVGARDDVSIGSFSPDTPPTQRFGESQPVDDGSELRRSIVLDRLTHVTSQLYDECDVKKFKELSFGEKLSVDRDSLVACGHLDKVDDPDSELDYYEEYQTPLTSLNLLSNLSTNPAKVPPMTPPEQGTSFRNFSPKSGSAKRKVRPHESPLLGKLDELTKTLAEIESTL